MKRSSPWASTANGGTEGLSSRVSGHCGDVQPVAHGQCMHEGIAPLLPSCSASLGKARFSRCRNGCTINKDHKQLVLALLATPDSHLPGRCMQPAPFRPTVGSRTLEIHVSSVRVMGRFAANAKRAWHICTRRRAVQQPSRSSVLVCGRQGVLGPRAPRHAAAWCEPRAVRADSETPPPVPPYSTPVRGRR